MTEMYHALVLNLHQPAGNIEQLLHDKEWEAKEILFALDRIPRMLWGHEDLARVHVSLSGTLLETLADPEFQQRMYGHVKCGDILWFFQNRALFELLGTGYYHPVLPLIPPQDWEAHLQRWLGAGRHLFWRREFGGFWPPEMSFCMELIPLLKKLGYQYVLVDSENVEAVTPMSWEELRYRPHIARYGGEEIIVVVRDRALSDAQESGMDPGWFIAETHERMKHCDFPTLVTTCSDGENGGWFRNTSEQGNFWGVFYLPLLQQMRAGETAIRPIFIPEYLRRFGAHGEVTVRTAAWNTGWHNGEGFTQWTGSPLQRDGLRRVRAVSADIHAAKAQIQADGAKDPVAHLLEEAYWRLLRAQTSCNFYWGEDWVWRCHQDLDQALRALGQALAAQYASPPVEDSASQDR